MCNCSTKVRELDYVDWDGNEHYVDKWYGCAEDLDTHRTKCSRCGEIGYYSGAARSYYEEGKRTPGVAGLE